MYGIQRCLHRSFSRVYPHCHGVQVTVDSASRCHCSLSLSYTVTFRQDIQRCLHRSISPVYPQLSRRPGHCRLCQPLSLRYTVTFRQGIQLTTVRASMCSRLCLNLCNHCETALVIQTVLGLTAAKFKPLVYCPHLPSPGPMTRNTIDELPLQIRH
jgi:hypothetical protein